MKLTQYSLSLGENVLNSELIPEILKDLSLETISIYSVEKWITYLQRSADHHKGYVGTGFSCHGYCEGRVALGTHAANFKAELICIYEAALHLSTLDINNALALLCWQYVHLPSPYFPHLEERKHCPI